MQPVTTVQTILDAPSVQLNWLTARVISAESKCSVRKRDQSLEIFCETCRGVLLPVMDVNAYPSGLKQDLGKY